MENLWQKIIGLFTRLGGDIGTEVLSNFVVCKQEMGGRWDLDFKRAVGA